MKEASQSAFLLTSNNSWARVAQDSIAMVKLVLPAILCTLNLIIIVVMQISGKNVWQTNLSHTWGQPEWQLFYIVILR